MSHKISAMNALANIFQWATLLDMTSEEAEVIHPLTTFAPEALINALVA